MRILSVILVLALLSLAAYAQTEILQAGENQEFVDVYNKNIGDAPFVSNALGGETIVVSPEKQKQFGVKTIDTGKIKQYNKQPYSDSTMKLYISSRALDELRQSDNPKETFRALWGNEIRYEGISIFSSIKFFFIGIGLWFYNLFSPPHFTLTPPQIAVTAPVVREINIQDMLTGSDYSVPCLEPETTPSGPVLYLAGKKVLLEGEEVPGAGLGVRPAKQPNNYTCVPAGLTWIFLWLNKTHPGVAVGNATTIFRNVTRGLVIERGNGTKTASIPPGVADYLNRTGHNSTIHLYANWTSGPNGTWLVDFDGDNESDMQAKNRSMVWRGQNLSVQPTSDYISIVERELEEKEGLLLLFDQHAVVITKIVDRDFGQVEVMDPAQGEFVQAIIQQGEVVVYDKDGGIHRTGKVVMIIAISPDKL